MIDIEQLTVEELEYLRDACNRRLLRMRNTERLNLTELLRLLEEVKITLKDQGKHWRSLEHWQWKDGQICFWLNPTDQVRYRSGWYSIDELIAWTHDYGPIMADFDRDVAAECAEDPTVDELIAWTHDYGPIMADFDRDAAAECAEDPTVSTVDGVAISWLASMADNERKADTEQFELV